MYFRHFIPVVGVPERRRGYAANSFRKKTAQRTRLQAVVAERKLRPMPFQCTEREVCHGTPAPCFHGPLGASDALLTRTITGKMNDVFTCGSLGSLKVEAGGAITAGPPTIFTNKNFDLYTF